MAEEGGEVKRATGGRANLVSAAGDAGNNQETGERQAQHGEGDLGPPARYADGTYSREYDEPPGLAIVRRHHEGRAAVAGKPLELMTRDELLAYIQGHFREAAKNEQEGQTPDRARPVITVVDAQEIARHVVAAMRGGPGQEP